MKKVSVIFLLFVLDRFTPDPLKIFKVATRLKSTVPERISTISASGQLDMSMKGCTVKQEVFSFLSVLLKLEYNIQERCFPCDVLSNSKET